MKFLGIIGGVIIAFFIGLMVPEFKAVLQAETLEAGQRFVIDDELSDEAEFLRNRELAELHGQIEVLQRNAERLHAIIDEQISIIEACSN